MENGRSSFDRLALLSAALVVRKKVRDESEPNHAKTLGRGETDGTLGKLGTLGRSRSGRGGVTKRRGRVSTAGCYGRHISTLARTGCDEDVDVEARRITFAAAFYSAPTLDMGLIQNGCSLAAPNLTCLGLRRGCRVPCRWKVAMRKYLIVEAWANRVHI